PRHDTAVPDKFLQLTPVEDAAGRRLQSLRVLPTADEIRLSGLPHPLAPVVNPVSNVRIEFRRADVRIEVQTETQSKDHADSGDIAVREYRLGKPNRPEENRVRGFA